MKRLFLLLALCGMVAVGCTEGGVDDNIDNGGNNTEQPGEDDDDENKEDETTFITDSEGNVVVEAEGGKVVVTVTTDIEYSVEIPEEAQSWLSVADTRTIRMEKLTFTVADNNTFEERSANVELVDSDGKSLQTIKFLQHASDKVFEIDDEGKYIIEAQGGVIEVDVTTNIEYDVVIPDDAQQWISVADTRAEVRNEKLTFTVAANETFEERSADVELVDSKGKSLQTINFTQLAKSNVMANNEIWYTTTDNKRIIPPSTEPTVFGAYFISNTYSDGKGVLTFDGEITKIGNGAFKDIGNLASITIPDSVTTIGDSAFSGCTSLTSITIGKGVTSIGKNAFYGCTGELIVNCNIPSASTVENGPFYGSRFTRVTIGDSVTSIGDDAFYNCDSLTSVTIGNGVTSIGDNAFWHCDSLTSVYITDIAAWCNISFVDSSSNPLRYAGNLCLNNELVTDLIIPDGVTSIGYSAFYGCTSLTSVTIPDSVTSIGDDAFYNCTSLTSVTIPDSVTSIGDEAFCGCSSLTSVTIPDSVTSIGNGAFGSCTSLTSVTIPDSVTSIGYGAFYKCTSLTSVTIPDSVTSIGNYAFENCTSLTSITIPDSVKSIGSEAFRNCTSLTSITIGKGVTSIGINAFYGCTGELIVNCKIFGAYRYENGTFYGSEFTRVTIGDSVTWIGSYAFSDCSSLTSITIPDSVTSIEDYAFQRCHSLTSVTIGNGVTSIGEEAFWHCTSLTSVYITDIAAWCNISFVDDYSNPLRYAGNLYLNNELVTDLIIPDGVTSIGYSAFYGCTSLTSVTIPDSVTSIGNCAFYDCTSLTSVTIPDSVTSIGDRAFRNCTSLKEVYCKPTTPPTGVYTMFYNNASGRKIYVPSNSVSAYKSASGWSSYASDIVGYDF